MTLTKHVAFKFYCLHHQRIVGIGFGYNRVIIMLLHYLHSITRSTATAVAQPLVSFYTNFNSDFVCFTFTYFGFINFDAEVS
jgi:hypothetical protein